MGKGEKDSIWTTVIKIRKKVLFQKKKGFQKKQKIIGFNTVHCEWSSETTLMPLFTFLLLENGGSW